MLMNSLEHLLIPADSREEAQQTPTENEEEKKIHVRADKTVQNWLKIKSKAKIRGRVSIFSTSSRYLSAPRRWRLGILHPSLPKTHIPAGITETHQVRWSLHTPLSPHQENLPTRERKASKWHHWGKKKAGKKFHVLKLYQLKRNLMMAQGSQGTGFVPTAKYWSREHVIPYPAIPTFSSQPNTQQSWLWLSQLHQTAFWKLFLSTRIWAPFSAPSAEVEVAFNSHGFSAMNI